MKPWRTLVGVVACLGVLASSARAELFDHSSYESVLHHYVDEDGYVDYDSIRLNSLSALESYFERLGDADLAGWPYPERVAFWINAYNARVLYLVAQKPGMKKISEDFEMFNRPFKIAGTTLSLNDIEHRVLRGVTNPDNQKGPLPGLTLEKRDPRIHFAIVRGTIDCPRLRTVAYTAENVNRTLDANALAFANSYKYVGVENGHLVLSNLLKWYETDFKTVGGVQSYLITLLGRGQREDAEAVKTLLTTAYKKAWFRYDWTVNSQKFKPAL